MKLTLQSIQCGAVCTIGKLFVDGVFECYTLEDTVRSDGVKVFGETAIPAGTYDVQITPSPKFKRDLPLLINVKGFVGVRIHPGNTASDTEGCILLGMSVGTARVDNSRKAFDALFPKLQRALAAKDKISLEVNR